MFLELTTSLLLMFLQAAPPSAATCRTLGVDPERTWQFERAGTRWQVSHWRGDKKTDAAQVSLPASAEIRMSATAVHVRARTSNGGIDVTLQGTPASATLDIYVSYELEVNVDTSLTPRIDELNTDGPLAVRCDLP